MRIRDLKPWSGFEFLCISHSFWGGYIYVLYPLWKARHGSADDSTLLMVKEIGADNCGVTIDYGHALVAYENVAESVAMLKKYGDKLFHVHMNDNFSFWDDDMITGSIHTIPYLEFLYWLKRTGYNGYISMDQYPYREDGRNAVEESVGWLEALNGILEKIPEEKIEELFQSGDSVKASRLIREYMFSL